ncbi:Transposon Ty3-I Gag-Pol polyprotein [Smittium culicis]|uniref:Transposon Ty3-I Gag-Pol polyprotein n=1 Tax=Smittium culicis TaxID=133412 RepID=A0A1R1Y3J1_9FUNG|nr:Transposon Ty3-I Gag-Pol polyprotein [Smittium culicis]
MSEITPTSSNQSSPLRTPPILGADYEDEMEHQSTRLSHYHAPDGITEFTSKDPAPLSTFENTKKGWAKASSSDESSSNEQHTPPPIDTDSYASSIDSARVSPTVLRTNQYAQVYALFDSPTISKHLLDKKSAYVGAGILQKQTPIDTLTRNLRNLSVRDDDKRSVGEYTNPEQDAEDSDSNSSPANKPTTSSIKKWIYQAPPIFHGRWDEDVWKFAELFNKHVNSLNVTLDSEELLNYFKEYLEDEALRVVEPLMVLYPEWDAFIVNFTQRFTTPDRKSRAKKEFKKMSIYAEDSLFTFAKLVKIFQVMGQTDEATKVVEILKKCNEIDRNRLLDKDVTTVEEIMNFFAKKEEQKRIFDKNNVKNFHVASHATDNTDMFKIKRAAPGSNTVLEKKTRGVKSTSGEVSTTGNFSARTSTSRPFCKKCKRHGHSADTCRTFPTETPTRAAESNKREPVSSLPRPRQGAFRTNTPYQQRMDVDSTPYRNAASQPNNAHVNLVSIGLQSVPASNVAAIKGKVKVNKQDVIFQYDSGSSINVVSAALVHKLKLRPVEVSNLLITPVSGESKPSKIIKSVVLEFPTFSCTAAFSVIEDTRPDLFLIGVDFMVTIGAEISLRNKQLSVEIGATVHYVPLILETRSDFTRAEVATTSHLPEFVDVNSADKFDAAINEELTETQKLSTRTLLNNFNSTFAEKLEDLRGAEKDAMFTWAEAEQNAFEELKQRLLTAPLLQYPDWNLPFVLITDASTLGLGAILAQGVDGRDRIIGYASRTLLPAEQNYAITHLEGLAVVWAIEYYHYYLYGRKFEVITDHRALTTLFSNAPGKGRLGRWVVKLRHYDFSVRHKEGVSNPADFLSRFPWEEIPEVLEEEVLYLSAGEFNQLKKNTAEALDRITKKRPLPGDGQIKSKYDLNQDKLYVKINNVNKLYVHPNELKDVVRRVHNENHKNAAETFRILADNYFVPGAFPIVKDIVRRCEQCQRHNYIVRRTEPYSGIQAKYPFQQWGLDVAGPLTPVSSAGNKYIIVAIDYFTKWPVAVATKTINAATIIAFLCEQIVAPFGVPKILITDRGTHLSNEACASFNRYLGIDHKPVTAYRPQANGQVERSIQTLKQTLRKLVVDKPENWDCYLWRALLAMRTTKNRTLNRSPAEIVYGLKLLTPAVWGSQEVTTTENMDTVLENRRKFLELELPTYRQIAYDLGVKTKEIDARYYNKTVKTRKIKKGDKVLKALIEANTGLAYKNVGPFIVTKDLGDGTYEIVDNNNNTDRVHADRLIQYQSEWGQVPRVQTGQARSTLPSLLRPLSRF